MSARVFIGLAMLGLTLAQTTVVSLFLLGADRQPLGASIIGNDATATTYSINCLPGTGSSDCGFPLGAAVIEGPRTVVFTAGDGNVNGVVSCSLGGTTTAICTETVTGSGANDPGTHTVTLAQSDITFLPVTVTAGSITSVSGSKVSASKTSSGSSTTSVNASGASGSVRSTGGMPQMTGNAQLMIGGAAIALAAAL